MKSTKDFVQFKTGTLADFRTQANAEIESINNTLDTETPVLHTFLEDEGKMVVTVSDEKKVELGLNDNVLSVEDITNFPLGSTHSNLVNYLDVIVGPNDTQYATVTDAINYSAALLEDKTNGDIVIVKLSDRKFTFKNYYVISQKFSNSKFLTIPTVVTGDAVAGASLLNGNANGGLNTDGVAV